MSERHTWQPPFSAASDLCGATVLRAGGGDECGLPRDHECHQPARLSLKGIISDVAGGWNNHHVEVGIYAGPDADHRAFLGKVTATPAEADELVARLAAGEPSPAVRTLTELTIDSVSIGGAETPLEWSCMVCGRTRPDAAISVAQRPLRGQEDAFPACRVNVRHCNDSELCTEAARVLECWHAAPAAGVVRRTPREWEPAYGRWIVDPDGWGSSSPRMLGTRSFDDPIAFAEFVLRAGPSTTAPLTAGGPR